MPSEPFSIAQVSPYPWEQHHEVNVYVERLADELCRRGHRVVVIAPSSVRELIREGRDLIAGVGKDPDSLFSQPGCAQLLAIGQSLPARRGGAVSLPVDVSKAMEQLLQTAELDFVHVHEPFAPSAASAALRHSHALNAGTFPPAPPPTAAPSTRPPSASSRLRWRAASSSCSSADLTAAPRASPPRETS